MAETNRLKEAALKEALASAERKLAEWPKLADAAVAAYKTRVVELTEALAAAEQRIASQRDQIHQSCIATTELSARAKAAESECSALRAENQHLRAIEDGQRTRAEKAEDECATLRAKLIDREEKFVAKHAQLVAAESRLAAANALLELMLESGMQPSLDARIRAHLANQPATVERTVLVHDDGSLKRIIEEPPYQQQRAEEAACAASDALLARPETPARTRRVSTPAEAAQAVLDAMAAVTEGELGLWITYGSRGQIQVAKAELARRKEPR